MIQSIILVLAAIGLVSSAVVLFFSSKRIFVFWASVTMSMLLGTLLWCWTQEPLVLFFLTALLVSDAVLVLFAPMLDTLVWKNSESIVGKSSWGAGTSIWLLLILAVAGLSAIWHGEPEQLLNFSNLNAKAIDPELHTVAWEALLPYLGVGTLILMGVSVGALLLFKVDEE